MYISLTSITRFLQRACLTILFVFLGTASTLAVTPLPSPSSLTPTPSPSPSTSPSPPFTDPTLEGTVTFKQTNVGLEGVVVELTQGTNKFAVTSDNKGYYKLPTQGKLSRGTTTLTASRPGFRTYTTNLNLNSGLNTHNFNLVFTYRNTVEGVTYQMIDGKKKTIGGISIVAENIDTTVSDTKTGEYDIWDSKFVKGSYRIWAEDSQGKISDTYTITFTQDDDQTLTQDIKINRKPNNRYELRVAVFDRGWWIRDGIEPIAAAKVTLTATINGVVKTYDGETYSKGIATFPNLDEGSYSITVTKVGHYDTKGSITLSGKPNPKGHDKELFLEKKNIRCEKHSQPAVEHFWFCGDEAIAMYTAKPDLWAKIDQKISAIRAQYPQAQYKDMPQQVIIDSLSYRNAFYSSAHDSSATSCPTSPPDSDLDDPMFAETITFTTGYLKESEPEIIVHTTTHEMGHNIDWRKGNCKNEFSDQSPFKDVYNLGEFLYGDDYFYGIQDGTYGTPSSDEDGHPDSNYNEGFASAFHALFDHAGEFPKMKNPIEELRQILLRTAELTKAT